MNRRSWSAMASLFLATMTIFAQAPEPEAVLNLLSPDARIIETATLNSVTGKPRILVLWIKHPKRVPLPPANARACEDVFYGDHWFGPTRLSLMDSRTQALINTIEIRPESDLALNDTEHSFAIPFFCPDFWYHVPKVNANHEGKPVIVNLRDLTGEGVAGQFPVFEYVSCGSPLSTVFGYSPTTDKVVQYPVEIIEAGKKLEWSMWGPQFFQGKSVGPGRWDFTWEPGHGCFCSIREQVSFDPGRQIFIDRKTVTKQQASISTKNPGQK